MFGALVVKTWRIYYIFKQLAFKTKRNKYLVSPCNSLFHCILSSLTFKHVCLSKCECLSLFIGLKSCKVYTVICKSFIH